MSVLSTQVFYPLYKIQIYSLVGFAGNSVKTNSILILEINPLS